MSAPMYSLVLLVWLYESREIRSLGCFFEKFGERVPRWLMMRWVTTDFVGSWSPIRMLPRRPLHDRIVEREIFLPFDFPSLFFFCNITLFARHFVWISLVRNNLLKGSNPAGQQQKSNKNLKLQQGDSLRLLHPSLSLSLSLRRLDKHTHFSGAVALCPNQPNNNNNSNENGDVAHNKKKTQ